MNKIFYTLLLCLSAIVSSYAQLNDFTLDIAVSDETCEDNGSLTFTIGNATEGADFLFTVFKLPDLVNPVEVTNATVVSNLDSGTYNVVAIQSLNGESNTIEQEVTIENVIAPLTYEVNSVSQNCSTGGLVEITTLTGTAAQYEIISGPETRPLQTSNIFEGLPSGTYNFRVFDDCGQGVVLTYTLVLESAVPVVTPPQFENQITTGCDSALVTNIIQYPESVAISYPITVTYTIHPPNGDPDIVETVTYTEGVPNQMELVHEIALYNDQPFTYDISIVNNCGNQYGNSGMEINPIPELAYSFKSVPCGMFYLDLIATNYSPPYILDLQLADAAFNAADYNAQYPGNYDTDVVTFGAEDNPMPEGDYTATITDACGRTSTIEFTLENDAPVPSAVGRNNGCYAVMGRIIASVPDREIVFAEILSGPPEYIAEHPEALPHDVSSFINNSGRLVVTNLPIGDYVIHIIDECGQEYELPVNIPPFEERDFTGATLADCTEGVGAVSISSGNGALSSISLTNAAPGYDGPTGDLSDLIDSTTGDFFMDNLPEGNYIFTGVDICGIERTVSLNVQGFVQDPDPFTLFPNCGSFDIAMSDSDNVSSNPGYWLQVLNEDGTWGHPLTGAVYPEGTIPTEDNSFPLLNNQTTFNLTFSGDFRIIKAFVSFGNASDEKNCIIELGTFTYLNQPRINGIYKLSCSNSPDDIFIDADGIPPLQYSVVDPATNDLILDNGSNNVFSNLPPGEYTFVVEDDCGNFLQLTRTINTLPNLVEANQPDNLFECVPPGEPLEHVFDLSQLNSEILGSQAAQSYTLTYHLSAADAETGDNPLPEEYNLTQESVTIYARLIHNQISICHDVVSFTLSIGNTPVLDIDEQYYLCEGSFVTLSVGNIYDTYQWSNGATTSSIFVYEPGIYSVTVTDGSCAASADLDVVISQPATSLTIDFEDWTVDENIIYAHATGLGLYEYSIDGENYQADGVFEGLETGIYTIFARDVNGCGVLSQEVALLNYPKFFTPNGDGINETWRIPFSWFEEGLTIVVMDRYGKVITSLDAESPGWDGLYNGNKLPSTDYWFIVNREDGRVHKGHFSMIR